MTIWGIGPRLLVPPYAIAAGCLWLTSAYPWLFAIPLLPRSLELILSGLAASIGLLLLGLSAAAITSGFSQGRLVREGVYALVRHPIYSAHIVFLMPSLALLLDSGLILLVALGTGLAFTRLIRGEEAFLHQKFGDQYLKYRDAVPALVPFRRPRRTGD